MTNKTLGRGLSAFLVDINGSQEPHASTAHSIIKINVNHVMPSPYQPRHVFDDESLQSLAQSIKSKGVLQPILVKKISEGNYQLIAGERRLRASKIAEVSEIPAIILDADEKEQLEIAILENIQREDLNPIDEAESYKRLIDEFHHTQEKISEILGKSRSHITNMLRLLSLPDSVLDLVRRRDISFGHAKAIVGLENASALADRIVQESMTVRETENLVRDIKANPHDVSVNSSLKTSKKSRDEFVDPEILNVANQISLLINLRVHIKMKKDSGGTVELEFKDFEELDMLVRRLNISA